VDNHNYIIDFAIGNLFKNLKPVDNPTGFFIAGQPGSGKSSIVKDILLKNKNNYLVIDTDSLRKYHPDYNNIMQTNPNNSYELTISFANKLADILYKKAIKEKKNILFDVTFGSGYQWQKDNYIKTLKNNNYKVELAAIAVNPIISTIGINYRPENEIKDTPFINARTVPFHKHNEIYQNIEENIEKSIKDKIFNKFHLYGRNNLKYGSIYINSYNNNLGKVFLRKFKKERLRKLLPLEKKNLNDFFLNTKKLIIKRTNSKSKDLSSFRDDINYAISFLQKMKNLNSKKVKKNI